jgi:hypothetical protein
MKKTPKTEICRKNSSAKAAHSASALSCLQALNHTVFGYLNFVTLMLSDSKMMLISVGKARNLSSKFLSLYSLSID